MAAFLLYSCVRDIVKKVYSYTRTLCTRLGLAFLLTAVVFRLGIFSKEINNFFYRHERDLILSGYAIASEKQAPSTYFILNSVLHKIKLASKDPYPENVSIVLSTNPSPNAFALPTGEIIVNAGILNRVGSLHHVAGILGHEFSHLTNQHFTRQITFDSCLVSIIFLGYGSFGLLSLPITIVVGYLSTLLFHRNLEYEADDGAAELMASCGFDRHAYGTFLGTRMGNFKYLPPVDDLKEFTSTHPIIYKRALRVLSR